MTKLQQEIQQHHVHLEKVLLYISKIIIKLEINLLFSWSLMRIALAMRKHAFVLISHLLSARHTLASGLLRSHRLMCAIEPARQSIVGNY